MATTQEAKSKGKLLLDSVRYLNWQSLLAAAIIAALLVVLLVQAVRDPGQFVSQLLVGITNGAIIALIALGYTLVYGIVELINFAHGDNFMIGSFVGCYGVERRVLGSWLLRPGNRE
jgi:ABC-type branched-subunit amino acid transport system permease subunit